MAVLVLGLAGPAAADPSVGPPPEGRLYQEHLVGNEDVLSAPLP